MDILDIDEVLKDDSFLCFEGKTHDDVVNILRQWKQCSNPPLVSSIGSDGRNLYQNADQQTGGHKTYEDRINTATFTRPKCKPFVTLDVNTPISKLEIGGYVTTKSMLEDISPPASINVMTPLIHKSMLQDTSPPASICSSIDKSISIDRSLITSADFNNISFLQTPKCFTLQDMISDRKKLESLTLSSDDGTLLKDINIGQIDDITLQSKQTSSCSTMANSVDSMESTIVYAANEKTFEVDTNISKNNETYYLESNQTKILDEVKSSPNVTKQTMCLSNELNDSNICTELPTNFNSLSLKISTPQHDKLQKLSVELSPIDKNRTTPENPHTPNRHGHSFDLLSTPTSRARTFVMDDEKTAEDIIDTQLQTNCYNKLGYNKLAHKYKDIADMLQYSEEELEQQLRDTGKTQLNKEEMQIKQSMEMQKKRLNASFEESSSSQRGHTNSADHVINKRLLSRRSRLYDDVNLNITTVNDNNSHTKTTEESNVCAENEHLRMYAEKLDRRQQSRNRFKTIKLAKIRGENVPCIDEFEFVQQNEERVQQNDLTENQIRQKENLTENDLDKQKSATHSSDNFQKNKNLYMQFQTRPRTVKKLYEFSTGKANSSSILDSVELNATITKQETTKFQETSNSLGLKSKSYSNLAKPELRIKSVKNTLSIPQKYTPNYNQMTSTANNLLDAVDNTEILKPVSGIRAPSCIRSSLARPSNFCIKPQTCRKNEFDANLQEHDPTFCYSRPNYVNTKLQKNSISGIPKRPSSRVPAPAKKSGLPRSTSTTRR